MSADARIPPRTSYGWSNRVLGTYDVFVGRRAILTVFPPRIGGTPFWTFRALGSGFYSGRVLDLSGIDVDEIAAALADQTDYEHRWLVDPRTGQVAFWTSDTGIDGENPVEIDELDLIAIDPLPPYVWFQDMSDFAEGISDRQAARDLTQSLSGRGAFRRFKNQVYERHPELIPSWHALRDVRARRRAVEWLLDNDLIDDRAAEAFVTQSPDPDLP